MKSNEHGLTSSERTRGCASRSPRLPKQLTAWATGNEFDDGREPIAVMRCNRCGSDPDVDEDGVVCPLCRKRSPVRSDDLEELVRLERDERCGRVRKRPGYWPPVSAPNSNSSDVMDEVRKARLWLLHAIKVRIFYIRHAC